MSTKKEVEKQFKELKGERKWFKKLKQAGKEASLVNEIKKMGDIGCFHTDKQVVMSTEKYEHLAVIGYTQKLMCTLCKKQVGIGERKTVSEASLFYEEKLKEAILDEEAAVRMYHYLPSIAKEAGFDDHTAGFAIIAQQEETHKKHLEVMLNEVKRSG